MVVAGLVLVISGAGVVYWQHVSMLNQQVTRLNTENASVALAVSENRSIQPSIRPGTDVQVVDATNHVVDGSSFLKSQPPVSSVRTKTGARQSIRISGSDHAQDNGINIGVAQTIATPRGTFTVYTVTFGSQMENSTKSLIIGLAIALPLTLLILSLLIWIFIGLALRPIERMRRTVAALRDEELTLRVPLPPGDDEVAKLAITLNDMLQRLEDAQDRQRSFISDASHELRSPIASLLATVEVARRRRDEVDWDAVSAVVIAEATRLNLLVNDLLLLASMNEQRAPGSWVPIDLDELVFAEVQRLEIQSSLTVKKQSVAAARIWGDQLQVDRSIRNIVDNAVRHATTEITFSLYTDTDNAYLLVSDDGPGINPEEAESLFERFTRSDDGRDRPSGGAGLGLSIVSSILEHHGGSVRFLPVPKGATIELRFPLLEPLTNEQGSEEAQRMIEATTAVSTNVH